MDFHHLLEHVIGRRTRYYKKCFASKKGFYKPGKLLGNKIADAVTKSNGNKTVKQQPVEEIIIPREERDEILNELRELLLRKQKTMKYLSC